MSVVLKNLSDVEKYIKTIVNISMEESVIPDVQADFSENANADVYGVYDPYFYDRSYSLRDNQDTYRVDKEGDMEYSITVDHPQAKLIEYGDGADGLHYEYPYNRDDTAWKFLNPRPFYRHTVERLEGGRFKELCTNAFRANGLDVK